MSNKWNNGDSSFEILKKIVENTQLMAGGEIPVVNALTQEDGFLILQEDGSEIII